jgi:hypothetical protein
MTGSGTVSTLTFSLPCHVSALIGGTPRLGIGHFTVGEVAAFDISRRAAEPGPLGGTLRRLAAD